jgi:hypothetical protein
MLHRLPTGTFCRVSCPSRLVRPVRVTPNSFVITIPALTRGSFSFGGVMSITVMVPVAAGAAVAAAGLAIPATIASAITDAASRLFMEPPREYVSERRKHRAE